MKQLMVDSVRTRLTLWYVSILALVLVTFSIGVYTLMSRALYARIDENLRSVIQITIKSLTHDAQEGQSSVDAAQSTVSELFNAQQALAIFDDSGKLLAENTSQYDFHARLPEANLIAGDNVYLYTLEEDDDDDHLRLAVQRVRIAPANTEYFILVSQPLERIEDELESLRKILYYAVPVALIFAGLSGWFLARKSLAPVVSMSEKARRIGAETINERLPVSNARDELGQLAAAFNELLGRLSAAFAQQRQFMADASHELRTPLSVMHTAADVTLTQAHRREDEYRDALEMINEQTQRLTRIVEDMFILARADAGRYPLRRSKFYLDELLAETVRAGNILAARKNVTIQTGEFAESFFSGDEGLLRQMFLNLLDNAIKHTPAGGTVKVNFIQQQDAYLIAISDTGAGIPAEAQAYIFERFYRADKARSRSAPYDGGAGLGLSIALWIAEIHQGSLKLQRSDETGSTFEIALPVSVNS
jgi:two-component system OmpR family sensor kinase